MSDDRPRPQYGEYAPPGWVSPHLAPEPQAQSVQEPIAAPARERRTWDTALTLGLLGLGLYTVLSGYLSYSNMPAIFDQVFAQLGVGDFTSDAAAQSAAVAANIVGTVVWIVVAVFGTAFLRRGRIAFWWPLAGGIVANLVIAVIFGIVMAGDPAYAAYMAQLTP